MSLKSIPPEELGRVIQEQNPWGSTGQVPEVLAKTKERPLGENLWQRVLQPEPRRFQVILGPRRVGKTTVTYQTVRHLLASGIPARRLFWFRLDHPLLLQVPLEMLIRAAVHTGAASQGDPVYLFLDELVYAKDWDLWLKTFYDEHLPVQIVATSSATAALRDRRPESGIGRWEEQYLMPYLFTEFLQLIGIGGTFPIAGTLYETIGALINSSTDAKILNTIQRLRRLFVITGGFPELLVKLLNSPNEAVQTDEVSQLFESQTVLKADAVERAIYKDIPQAVPVDSPMLLERFLYTLADQVTGILSPSKICSELGCSKPTFDRYLSHFERAFLVFTLPNYSTRELSVQKRGRKLYFVDGAVRNAALQRGIAFLSNQYEMGLIFENLAASQLHGLAIQAGVRLFHWRDGQDEVDLVYDQPEHPMAFEIASSADHPRRGLIAFCKRHPRFHGRCYLVAPDAPAMRPESTTSGVGTLPLDLFLLAVGRQAEAACRFRLASGSRPIDPNQGTLNFSNEREQPSSQ